MNKKKFLVRLIRSQKNVKYRDFIVILTAFGFRNDRSGGSHNIYVHDDIPDIVNTQNENGEAKPYQIKQFLRLVEMYKLKLGKEDKDDD